VSRGPSRLVPTSLTISDMNRRPKKHAPHKLDAVSREVTDLDVVLTEQQRLYVHHLVHNQLSHSAAVRMAGYAHINSAVDLRKNPKVQRAIAIEREEYAKASRMTKQKVIDGFLEAVDMARIKGEPLAMIAGWREVGKMCGFYEPTKTEIQLSVNGRVLLSKLNTMSDEELLALTEQDSNALEGQFEVIDVDSE